MRFEELARQLEELKEQNESLQAEIRELKRGGKPRRSLLRDISNGDKASALFGIKAADGKLAPAADKFTSHFCTFYQGLFRFIIPEAYKDPTSGIERVVYRKLEKVTDEEYRYSVKRWKLQLTCFTMRETKSQI